MIKGTIRPTAQLGAVVAVALLFTACAPGATSGAQQTTIKSDEFSTTATVLGIESSEIPFGGTFRTWRLRSFVDKKNHETSNQLYIDISYIGDWRFYNSAADDEANPREVLNIDRSVGNCSGGCSVQETIAVVLDDHFLRAHASQGFRIKLSAHSGDELILPVTAAMIQQQVQAIDAIGGVAESVGGTRPHVTLGVKFAPVPAQMAALLGQPVGKGLWVLTVEPGSVAQINGIKKGDVIKAVDGKDTDTVDQMRTIMSSIRLGGTIHILVNRGRADVPIEARF